MQLKVFILPIKNLIPAEAEMNGFLRSHRVLSAKKEFVADGDNSFWTICVEYLESAPGGNALAGVKAPKVDYKEVLKPEEFEVFSRLRDWPKRSADIPVGPGGWENESRREHAQETKKPARMSALRE